LLLSLQHGLVVAISPPAQLSSHGTHQHTSSINNSNSPNTGKTGAGRHLTEVNLDQVQGVVAQAEIPLLHLQAMPQVVGSSLEVVGVGSDGQLHRLLLPTDAAGWAALKGRSILRSASKLQLPGQAAAVSISPNGHMMLVSSDDGSLAVVPTNQLTAGVKAPVQAAPQDGDSRESSSEGVSTSCAKNMVFAHQGSKDMCAGVLTWSAGGQWAASAATDGSLLLHVVSGVVKLWQARSGNDMKCFCSATAATAAAAR
jgi:hypothetical protein